MRRKIFQMLPLAAAAAAAICGSLVSAAEGGEPQKTAPESEEGSTTSVSGQFVVYGQSSQSRNAMATFAEEVKASLEKTLHLESDWKFQVVIQIATTSLGRPLRFAVGSAHPLDIGYRFQVDVLLVEGFTREELSEELLRVLLMERILRGHPALKADRVTLLPPWLHLGIVELVRYEREGTPNRLFEGILATNAVLSVEEILDGSPHRMNSLSRAVFCASSAAFLKTLLGWDSGTQRLAAFLRDLPLSGGTQRELLLKKFPGLALSPDALEKWWTLEVATLAQPTAFDFLDAATTEARLNEALTVRLPPEPQKQPQIESGESLVTEVPLSAYENFIRRKDREAILEENQTALVRLSYESFPLYRGIVDEYSELVGRILKGKKRGLEESFAMLAERREGLSRRMQDIDDYLNWFEATQMGEKSGKFEDYRRSVDLLNRKKQPREDEISRFLDRADANAKP